MLFHLRILKNGLKQNKFYLVLMLVPCALYLLIQAWLPQQYTLTREIRADEETMLSLGPNPLNMVSMAEVTGSPDILFTDSLALMELREHLLLTPGVYRQEWASWLPSSFSMFIKRTVHGSFALEHQGQGRFQMKYSGSDRKLGQALINFYSGRLVRGAAQAAERSLVMAVMDSPTVAGGLESGGLVMEGPIQVSTSRTLYAGDRTVPAAWILGISAVVVISLIWLAQYLRPRLYTPRQASRYLNVRILGSVPDLNKLEFS